MIPHPKISSIRLLKALLFLFLSVSVFSPYHPSACAAEKGMWLTDQVQLKLGDAFMEEGEYYRAVTEYKKLLILFPDSDQADYALYQMGMAYYQGEDYVKGVTSFSSLEAKYKRSQYLDKAQFYKSLCFWKLNKLEAARMAFDDLANSCPQSPYAPLSLMGASLVALQEENVPVSRAKLEELIHRYPDAEAAKNASEAMPLVGEYQKLPQKSKTLAAILSAIVPGSGYMYAGHFGDGITAFVINSLWIAGAVTGIQADYYAVAGVLAGVGLPFYFGNIYGSANAAKKWNIRVRRDLRDRVVVALDFRF